eukprot:8518500-Pyramimonas_sp.AAC.1
MGRKVQRFWPTVSLGLLRYDMDRTQSIMRIATTASPVSGMDVRDKMLKLSIQKERQKRVEAVKKVSAPARRRSPPRRPLFARRRTTSKGSRRLRWWAPC